MKKAVIFQKSKPHPTFCKAKCAIQSKQGFSYILTCVVILCIAIFIFCVMQYGYIYHVAESQQESVQLQLDGYVTRQSIAYYDALKQGEPYENYIDRTALVSGAYTLLGFPQVITLEYRETVDEKTVYTMSRPEIDALTGGSVGLYVTYELTVPFELFGRKVADIHVPVKMVSKLTER